MRIEVTSSSEFGTRAASAFLAAIDGIEKPVVGLPSGATPIAFYAALRSLVEAGQADISRVQPHAIDEYGGPPGHPGSNHSYFARHWSTIPGAREVACFDPEARDLDAECAWFAAMVEAAGGLDVAVLGIGLNGHLAFNEPGAERHTTARRVVLSRESRESATDVWADAVPTLGLTLGLRELLGARTVLLFANGAHKAAIVARALHGPIAPECPASFIQDHPRAVVVLDFPAAGLLKPGSELPHPT